MRSRVALAAVAAFASTAALVLTITASPAGALDPNAVQTVVVGGPSGVLLPLQVDQLYPGVGTHARFVVRRGSTWSGGTFAAVVTDVEDLERGCNRPEQNAGDVSCGAGTDQGELSAQLLVNASWSSDVASCATAPVPGGMTPVRLADGLPFSAAADDACLVLALQLPLEADNLVQSDLVRFSLRIGLQNAVLGGMPAPPADSRATSPSPTPTPTETATSTPSEVSPSESLVPSPTLSPIGGTDEQAAAASPSAAGTRTAQSSAPVAAMSKQPPALPFTGGQPLLLVGWAALLMFAGRVLVLAARQRRA